MDKLFARMGLGVLAAFVISATLFSCRKEGDTVARIKIVDTASNVVPGAMVRVYPTPSIPEHGAIIIDDTLFTKADGIAIFNFTDKFNLGQAGFAVLDIEARSGDTLYGEGIIKIVEEETSEVTVVIQP